MRTRSGVFALAMLALSVQAGAGQSFQTEFNAQWGLKMVGVEKALARGLDGRGVTVGVQDSGIILWQSDFIGRISPLSSDGQGNSVIDDPNGHGTHVSGIIAANRDGTGMHGVASGATIVPLQIGHGGALTWTERARNTLQYGIANGVRIFNASWGIAGAHYDQNFATYRANAEVTGFYDVVNSGGVMVFANGNANPRGDALPLSIQAALPYYLPELQKGWLAVASVGPTAQMAFYSQHCSVAMNWCLAAPGGDWDYPDGMIYSTANDGGYTEMQGTSMAAPHVTGALAIAQQLYPNATPQQLRTLVLNTATDIGAAGIDPVYGWGLLNIGNIVDTASPQAGAVYAQQSWARQGVVNQIIDGLNPHASAERGGSWGFWAMPLGVAGTISNGDPALSANLAAGGLTAGVEGSIAPDWYVKMFGAASQSTVGGNGNSASDTGLHLGGQLVHESQDWFGEATLGGSMFAGTVQRRSAPGAGGALVGAGGLGSSSGLDWAQWAGLRVGHHFETRVAGTVSPYVFGRIVNQQLSPFRETGSALAISGGAGNSLTGELGVGLKWIGTEFETGPLDITPVLDVAYSHQGGNDDRDFNLLGSGFTASGTGASGHTLQLSAAAEISSDASPFDLKLGYSAEVRANSLVHTAGLKLMGAF